MQRDGPAWQAGLRPGDRILAVDGVELTEAEGGRRFGAIRAGDRVRWTVDRGGRTLDVSFQARSQAVVASDPVSDVVRYSGRVGDALVEVRGARVTVVENEAGRYLVIRTSDNEITIRVPGN